MIFNKAINYCTFRLYCETNQKRPYDKDYKRLELCIVYYNLTFEKLQKIMM